jgi:Acyl-protein synthetase, LuxE
VAQYSVPQSEKERILAAELSRLCEQHRAACPAYAKLMGVLHPAPVAAQAIAEVPWIPVSLFKSHELSSIPADAVFKVLTSSGTTSSRVSRILLDAESSARQTKALASVMTHLLGAQRLPMIIVDSRSTIRDRRLFSARGAGILGMATFGRNHFYALDDDMQLDHDGLSEFLSRHKESPLLIFGFTFMVWQYLQEALDEGEADLSNATLIHSGGWKRLRELAVSNTQFKRVLKAKTGLGRVHNFYGMVEQIGSVYLECDAGLLHAPNFSDVVIRDPGTWEERRQGEEGIVEVVSVLPTSYPGHCLMTEDVGVVIKVDDCTCGRKGKAVEISGRVPNVELRGCSDTHAADRARAA